MKLQRVQISVVRSIRHISLVRNWARARRDGNLPYFTDFVPDERSDDSQDILISERRLEGDDTRFFCIAAGVRVQQIFDRPLHGGYVRDVVDPNFLKVAVPVWEACIADQMPVYSIASVIDNNGCPVTIEQIYLPYQFGSGVVDTVVASIHAWSTEGRFTLQGLLANLAAPLVLQAMIVDPALSMPSHASSDAESI